MIIDCKKCRTSYNFDENLLKSTGSKVRCLKCKSVFIAYPPSSAGKPEKTGLAIKAHSISSQTKTSSTKGLDEVASDKLLRREPLQIKSLQVPYELGTVSEYFKLGIAASERNDLKIALEYFHKVARVLPKSPSSYLNISVLHYRMKKFNIARKYAQLALELGAPSARRILDQMENVIKAKGMAAGGNKLSREEIVYVEQDFGSNDKEIVSDFGLVAEDEETEDFIFSDKDSIFVEDGNSEGALSQDLSDMENIRVQLDDSSILAESSIEEDPGFKAGLDFTIDEDKDEARLESTIELESVEQLHLSDMENILQAEDEAGNGSESTDEENFDLELDFSSVKEEVASNFEHEVMSEKIEKLDNSKNTKSAAKKDHDLSLKTSSGYAIARIKDHEAEKPFYVNNLYTIEAGIQIQAPTGFKKKRILLPDKKEIEFEITIHAEEMTIESKWSQSFLLRRYESSPPLEFFIKPLSPGNRIIRIEYLYQRHWLTGINLSVEVLEKKMLNQ